MSCLCGGTGTVHDVLIHNNWTELFFTGKCLVASRELPGLLLVQVHQYQGYRLSVRRVKTRPWFHPHRYIICNCFWLYNNTLFGPNHPKFQYNESARVSGFRCVNIIWTVSLRLYSWVYFVTIPIFAGFHVMSIICVVSQMVYSWGHSATLPIFAGFEHYLRIYVC